MEVNTLMAGAAAGGLADVITHPFCTVKARLMCQGAGSAGGEIIAYKGFFDCFVKTGQAQGLKGLYAGLGVVLLGAAPGQAMFFTGMSMGGKFFEGTVGMPKESANFAAGLSGQLFGSLFWVPMEVAKEKLMIQGQMQTKQAYTGSMDLVSKVIKSEGIGGLYRGFWMQQLTYGPFNGIALAVYGKVKEFVPGVEGSGLLDAACSFFGYGVASAVTTPFDVVKTRIQVAKSNPEIFKFKGPIDCAGQILAKEGIAGFFGGVTARILWLTPRCGIALSGFNQFYNMLSSDEDASVVE